MPAVTTVSLPSILTFSPRRFMTLSAQKKHFGYEADEKNQRNRSQDQTCLDVGFLLLGVHHVVLNVLA
jgi:hypothetical protein